MYITKYSHTKCMQCYILNQNVKVISINTSQEQYSCEILFLTSMPDLIKQGKIR